MAVEFVKKKRLGTGHFGEVWLAYDPALAVERAVKIIPLGNIQSESNFFKEAQILKSADHANVVQIHEAGTLNDGNLYIAMEYCPHGSVEDEARGAPLSITRAIGLVCDSLRGLEHTHSKNILHRE